LIAAEKTNYPVAVMCRVLGVNRTAFHDWERRAPSDRALTDAWLEEKIKRIHEHSRGVYGAPRIHAELRIEHDVRVGRKRVARLMKAAGISGVRPRKRWRTTIRIPGITPATDLVERRFRPDSPNVLWVADITYLRTGEGWLYLAAVQDAYSRANRRLVDGHAHARDACGRRAQDGDRSPAPGARLDPPLRPGRPVREPRVRPGRTRRRDRGLDRLPRRRVRQRRRRDVLRHPQKGARQPPQLAVAPRAAVSRVRVHRGVPQPRAPPLHPRHALPRPPTNNHDSLRWAVETNRSNNNNQHQQTQPQVSRKPGQDQRGALAINGKEASAPVGRISATSPTSGRCRRGYQTSAFRESRPPSTGPDEWFGDQTIAPLSARRTIGFVRERSPTEPRSGSPDTSPITNQRPRRR
jgi:hypothetical protein